jgi:hypothetical protein
VPSVIDEILENEDIVKGNNLNESQIVSLSINNGNNNDDNIENTNYNMRILCSPLSM